MFLKGGAGQNLFIDHSPISAAKIIIKYGSALWREEIGYLSLTYPRLYFFTYEVQTCSAVFSKHNLS
jgi:hypothetical protein